LVAFDFGEHGTGRPFRANSSQESRSLAESRGHTFPPGAGTRPPPRY
jgi:hypothetical protein